MNMIQMFQKAQKIQKKMQENEEELSSLELSAFSNGDLVEVKVNGQSKILAVKIKPEAINSENPESVSQDDIEVLEDLILEAMKKAQEKAASVKEEKLKSITGGISIPGLF